MAKLLFNWRCRMLRPNRGVYSPKGPTDLTRPEPFGALFIGQKSSKSAILATKMKISFIRLAKTHHIQWTWKNKQVCSKSPGLFTPFIGVIFENKNQRRRERKGKRTEKNGENRVHYHRLLIPRFSCPSFPLTPPRLKRVSNKPLSHASGRDHG